MGLFSAFTKSPEKSDISWLEKVDDAYAHAFQVKNATGLENYLTRTCLVRQMERIRASEKAYSGISRYQHTTWTLDSKSDNGTYYIKKVTYDQIKMSHGVVAAVGDEYSERWLVVTDNGNKKVAEIRRIN